MKMENDLGNDKISKLVLRIAIPSMLAQFVNVLYSIVDRIFVGNIPIYGDLSLAGVGICGPIVTMITAFAFLIGIGGGPLLGIALGEGKKEQATKILANCFLMLCITSVIVTIVSLLIKNPMLHLFGASDITYPYAEAYFQIYVLGTIFALLSIGLYQFVIAQGYAKVGMCSIILGAVLNIILDPIFIFSLDLGVKGAAIATVISQACSALFVFFFLLKKAHVNITFGNYSLSTMLRVTKLGLTPFIIIAMDNLMIITMNALLLKYGGAQSDLFITINTIVQSFMLVITMPLGGISSGTQCILSYNYGAGNKERVKLAQKYIFAICVGYATLMFIIPRIAGEMFVTLFTSDPKTIAMTLDAIKICTLGIIPLGLQYGIVDGFTAMGQVQFSLPLSFIRKGIYFISIFILPVVLPIENLFYAEPISDFLSIIFSVILYIFTIDKILAKKSVVA